LDPVIAHTILDLIQSLHKKLHFTGIIVTHELARVFGIVERVALLYEGVIRFIGTPDEIMTSQDVVVQHFISGTPQGPMKLY
jgi:phospholipid/cholesterol/gamma-HCH transport system ATP-binding protein